MSAGPEVEAAPVSRRTVEGDGVRLAVTERGDRAAPTVLLVHGFPDTQGLWSLVAPQLAERFHVVTYDLRGAGESSVPSGPHPYSFEHLAADAAAVIEATSPDRPVHLVGHDWGAIQGWEFVYAEPTRERIASFTSLCGASFDHGGLTFRERLRRPSAAGLRGMADQLRRSWYMSLFQIPRLPELLWRTLGSRVWLRMLSRREGIEPGPDYPAPTHVADGCRLIGLYRGNAPSRLLRPKRRGQVQVPLLVVEPDADPFLAPSTIDGFARFAPNMRRRRVAGGHWIPRTDPDGLARLIGEHAERCERAAARASGV